MATAADRILQYPGHGATKIISIYPCNMTISVTGIPLVIVAVSLGATQGEGYGTESSCWLSVENKLIWAFVGPAFIVILVGVPSLSYTCIKSVWNPP